MILKQLSILNYKNIAQAEVAFSHKINCFFGNNGMGKTNLLDAIHYLSFCKSYINTPDSQLIRDGEEMCVLQGFYDYEGQQEEIFCGIRRKQRKQFKRNKKEYDKLSSHIGLLPLVMVSPQDADLIRGGSDERRKFIDMIISQQDKNYLNALIQYNKALAQRNVMLKEQRHDNGLYDVLEMQLSLYGETVHEKRKQLVEEFTPLFNHYYREICESAEVPLYYDFDAENSDGQTYEENGFMLCWRRIPSDVSENSWGMLTSSNGAYTVIGKFPSYDTELLATNMTNMLMFKTSSPDGTPYAASPEM